MQSNKRKHKTNGSSYMFDSLNPMMHKPGEPTGMMMPDGLADAISNVRVYLNIICFKLFRSSMVVRRMWIQLLVY